MICLSSIGSLEFSVLISNHIPALPYSNVKGSQCFPLYYYEPYDKYMFKSEDDVVIDGYVQKSAITDAIMLECRERFGEEVEKEDIFFYVYGALHSPGYRRRYENELKKELARLPLPETPGDFWTCSRVGRELADLHVNYETGVSTIPDRNGAPHKLPEPFDGLTVFLKNADGLPDAELYRVDGKMRLGTRKEQDETGRSIKVFDGTLKYNEHIALSGIPSDAFRYVVNGRSPVEWVVERYYRRLDKPSGIIDDPNLWSEDPKYIFNLIPRLIALSLRTLELVETLPDVG